MESLVFVWDKDLTGWKCTLPDMKLHIHRCLPTHTLICMQGSNDTHGSHELFDSIHEAQQYLYTKYNKEVKYRDPNEE
jgi:hypothetical protein